MKKPLSDNEQRKYLLAKIKEPVHFTYPEPPHHLEGILKDRFVLKEGEDEYVTYWDIVDLIEFKKEDEEWLRMTYYRYKKKENRWVFAGQTSLTNPISKFEELFVKAIKEKQWMKTFFKHVFKKCSADLN